MNCLYCGTTEDLETEHLVPSARGGLDINGNVFRACSKCNLEKSDRLPSEWRSDLSPAVYELERVALSLHPSVTARKSKLGNNFVPKTENINVRCTSEQKARIEALAERNGLGASTWLLQLGLIAAREKGIRP
jgi:hypothetical protein